MATATLKPAETAETSGATECGMHPVKPGAEHDWLHKFVGEWTYETEIPGTDGKPSFKATGTETVRSIGGLWVQGESRGEMPGGEPATMLVTLGYDTQKKRFVGTFIGSMMTTLWLYDGALDGDERTLTLYSEGPAMNNSGEIATYKDVVTFHDNDFRTMTSHAQGPDGQWFAFMTMASRRVK